MSILVNGEVLRRERETRDLTQEHLGIEAGVGTSTVARAELGKAIRKEKLRDIVHALRRFPVKNMSPHVELKPTFGSLFTKLAQSADPLPEQLDPLAANENPAPNVQTGNRQKLLKESQLEGLQDKVMAPDFVLSDTMLNCLLAAQDEYRDAEKESGHYASLILGYALLKAGPEKCQLHRSDFNSLLRLAQKDLPVSMAAKWIAGRAHLVWASKAKTVEDKHRETEAAHKMFNEIEVLSGNELAMPILLPGARQEYDEDELYNIGWTSKNDPLIRGVKKPARYIAATALALAGPYQDDPEDHRGKAISQSVEIIEHTLPNTPMWLNATLLELDARALKDYYTHDRAERRNLLKKARDFSSCISQTGNNISKEKKSEWLANCDACRALAIVGGNEGTDSIKQLRASLKDLVLNLKRIPDFLRIDPVYRVAFDSQDGIGFEEALRELERHLSSSQQS